jgi:hypothetical protein
MKCLSKNENAKLKIYLWRDDGTGRNVHGDWFDG